MKCKIPEISWHNREPVLSVDIQPNKGSTEKGAAHLEKNSAGEEFYRLATGGSDTHVVIWHVIQRTTAGEPNLDGNQDQVTDIHLELAADLTRHQRAVNVVKWSPNGKLLASGDDDSFIIIWKQNTSTEQNNAPTLFEDGSRAGEQYKETWQGFKVLRGHLEDVYDLSWSPNGEFLATGSVDNTAIIWDLNKGKHVAILDDHKGFVLGVAWDPKDKFIATLSTDRYLRSFDIQTKKLLNHVHKGTIPVPKDHALYEKRIRFYHDDTLQTFFRRLKFSIDGRLLITPCGVLEYENGKYHHSTYIFSRNNLMKPIIVLPCADQYSVAVACCPNRYCLHPHDPEKNPPVIPLPYRMILAVATRSSVFFYDTQQRVPFAVISNIHYTRLTDISWSSDGQLVVVSSTDGFCSLISFGPNELGEIYTDENEHESVSMLFAESEQEEVSTENMTKSDATKDIVSNGVVEKDGIVIDTKESTQLGSTVKDNAMKESEQEQDVEMKGEEETQNTNEDTKLKEATPKKMEEDHDLSDLEICTPHTKTEDSTGSSKENETNQPVQSKTERGKEEQKKNNRNKIDYYVRSNQLNTNCIVEKKSKKYTVSAIGSLILGSGNKPRPSRFGDQPAKPIAIRRAPRPKASPGIERVTNLSAIVEEALDAWPTGKPSSVPEFLLPTAPSTIVAEPIAAPSKGLAKESNLKSSIMDSNSAYTEDIRLVYEDDDTLENGKGKVDSKAKQSVSKASPSGGKSEQGPNKDSSVEMDTT